MRNWKSIAIVAATIAAAGVVFTLKHNQARPLGPSPETPAVALPRLVDLGADKCMPCKMMAPILEELKTAYAGQLEVEFIDVWKNEGAGEAYGVRVIPLQIFFDATGKELFRHEGFYAKEDILDKWKELGFEFQ